MQADLRQSDRQQKACNGEDRAISEADARHAPHVTPAGGEPAIGRIKGTLRRAWPGATNGRAPCLASAFGLVSAAVILLSPLGRLPSQASEPHGLSYASLIDNANSSATDALDKFAIKRRRGRRSPIDFADCRSLKLGQPAS